MNETIRALASELADLKKKARKIERASDVLTEEIKTVSDKLAALASAPPKGKAPKHGATEEGDDDGDEGEGDEDPFDL